MKKTTLSTIKSFAKKNASNLFITIKSHFDGMVDCVMPIDNPPKIKIENYQETLERYLVNGSGRNYFEEIENGFRVSNCCGDFLLTNQ